MRRLFWILIVTGPVLAVAQAAVAQLAVVPITVTSQTLEVNASGSTTGDVVGGSSVGTTWNLGNVHGSSVGSVSSVLLNGELVITVDGTMSKGGTTSGYNLRVSLDVSIGFVVPDSGAPVLLQLTKVNSAYGGTVEFAYFQISRGEDDQSFGNYSSQLLGGLVSLGYMVIELPPLATSAAMPLNGLIPNDTLEGMNWILSDRLEVPVDNSMGTFSETYTFRAITPIPLPEPSSSLTIPTGIGMLFALSKLRSVSWVH